MQSNQDSKKTQIAVFDLDGTSANGQSGELFTTYLLRHGMLSIPRAVGLGWWGIRYKLHLPYRQSEARELVFGALEGLDPQSVDELMARFCADVMEPRYRERARREVARCHEDGMVTLLVSATFETIARCAAESLGCDVYLATRMERDANGNYTGRVDGPVIAGNEKYNVVERWANEHIGPGAWELARAYGDHHSDEYLLSHAKVAFAVCPGNTMKPVAKRRGWQIMDWK